MANPLQGASARARASPHLALDTLSGQEVTGARDGGTAAMKSFEARLGRRYPCIQKLEDAPELEHRCPHAAFEGGAPEGAGPVALAGLGAGETGGRSWGASGAH